MEEHWNTALLIPCRLRGDSMRIVGGRLRHRVIQMTNLETTRETQDKVREAIFNMIGPYFDGGCCLDLFAGSGAMAIEAYSRGMVEIVMNDIHSDALSVCRKNCEALGIKQAEFSNLDYRQFLLQNTKVFDLIVLDPPYKMDNTEEILDGVSAFVKPGGLIVFEMKKESSYPSEFGQLALIKDKCYGIKRVVVYRRKYA